MSQPYNRSRGSRKRSKVDKERKLARARRWKKTTITMTNMETALRAALVAALETERVHGVREAAHQWELTGWSVEYCRTWWEAGYWHPGDALDEQKLRTATQSPS